MSEPESSTPATPWETAHEADRRSRMERRTASAQADIAAAPADPSFVVYEGAPPRGDNLDTRAIDQAELRVLRLMRAELASVLGLDGDTDHLAIVTYVMALKAEQMARHPSTAVDPARLPEGTILLSGPQAERYRALEAAAKRSLAAQTELTAAGAELRDAISGLCQALAPPG